MSKKDRRKKGRRRRREKSRRDETAGGAKQMTPELSEQLDAWADEACKAHDLRLFEVEPAVRGRWIVRVYVERLGEVGEGEGITVDECAEVSRYMEAYMDADERIPENYVLEVSSPGLERPLKKPRHLEGAVGEQVELVTRTQVAGQNKVVAQLVSYDDGVLGLELEELDEPVTIDWEDVAKARLKYDF